MKMQKAAWLAIRTAYLNSEGSCRELAERFGVGEHGVESRCRREQWRRGRAEVLAGAKEQVVESMAGRAARWVEATVVHGWELQRQIDEVWENLTRPIKPRVLLTLARATRQVDDLVRRALGLPDTPTSLDVKSNEKSTQESIMETFIELKKLHEAGKLKDITIDVDAVAAAEIEPDE